MRRSTSRLAALALAALPLAAGLAPTLPAAAQVPTPEEHLGRPVGEDRFLASYDRVTEYLRLVAGASERVTVEEAGRSTLGNEILTVAVTSEANSRELERHRETARRLANPDGLTPEEARELIAGGKAIVLVTCTIHSTEVGSTQMVMELVHDLATTDDPEVMGWLDEVILLIVPSINPDGQELVIDWYGEWLGTEYEGGRMPWLYHHYVGHDLNRDFFMLTQNESRAINQIVYHRWFPQVFLDEHQMGSTGPRMVVPPQTDPLAEEVHSLVYRQADLLGTAMALRLEEAGMRGVGSNMIFDSYWPGATRNTAWWKNVTGLLTEVASARLATPIYVDPGELSGGYKGLPDYVRRANFPSPWEGGWWRLRDIIDYELVATESLLESAAHHREGLLTSFYRMNLEAVERGASEPPYAFVVPPGQHDPVAAGRLVELMLEHGVRVHRAAGPFTAGRTTYPAGTTVMLASQPYRPFLLTMLRTQRYPEVRPYTGGPVIPPYDVTAWSLPVLLGVETVEVSEPFAASLERIQAYPWPEGPVAEAAAGPGGTLIRYAHDSAPAGLNSLLERGRQVYWLTEAQAEGAAGDLYLPAGSAEPAELAALAAEHHLGLTALTEAPSGEALRLSPVRVGLFKPYVASMDEGWTRFLLERYAFSLESLENDAMKSGDYRGRVDAIVLPDVSPSVIELGEPPPRWRRFWEPLPPAYQGGIAPEGAEQLKAWVEEDGGTLVALDASAQYAIDLFGLPVTDVLAEVDRETFNAPGSMVRILMDTTHPLAFGMRPEEAAYFANSAAYATRLPGSQFGRQVVARYPDDVRDILVSGHLEGGELLERRAALVEVEVGKGRVVLVGFRPQHRAQPHRTFKVLFNALFLAGAEAEQLP